MKNFWKFSLALFCGILSQTSDLHGQACTSSNAGYILNSSPVLNSADCNYSSAVVQYNDGTQNWILAGCTVGAPSVAVSTHRALFRIDPDLMTKDTGYPPTQNSGSLGHARYFQSGYSMSAGSVKSLAVYPESCSADRIFVGGFFSHYYDGSIDNPAYPGLVSLDLNGNLNSGFLPPWSASGTTGTPANHNQSIQAILPDPANDAVIVGGTTRSTGGVYNARVYSLDADDGSINWQWDLNASGGSVDRESIQDLAFLPNGDILVGLRGIAHADGSAIYQRLVRLSSTGTLVSDSGLDSAGSGLVMVGSNPLSINHINVISSTQVLLSGSFNTVNGTSNVCGTCILNPSTGWSLVTNYPTMQNAGNPLGYATVIDNCDRVYIAGSYNGLVGQAGSGNANPKFNNLGRAFLDGTPDDWAHSPSGDDFYYCYTADSFDSGLHDILLVDNSQGTIFVAGRFTSFDGISSPHVAFLKNDPAPPVPLFDYCKENFGDGTFGLTATVSSGDDYYWGVYEFNEEGEPAGPCEFIGSDWEEIESEFDGYGEFDNSGEYLICLTEANCFSTCTYCEHLISPLYNCEYAIPEERSGIEFQNESHSKESFQFDNRINTVRVFPNPAGDNIQIELLSGKSGQASVKFYDAGGKLQMNQAVPFLVGKASVNISALPAAFYTIVISGEGVSGVGRVVIE